MSKSIFKIVLLLFVVILFSCKNENSTSNSTSNSNLKTEVELDTIETKPTWNPPEGWIEISDKHLGFHLDIRYATDNNFVEEQMYECGKCFLQEKVAKQLWMAKKDFVEKGYELVLYDCYRPKPVQQKLWDKVPDARYVTPPKRGSMHNKGAAIDLGLTDLEGNILDMGTEYDYFGVEAYQTYTKHPKEIMDRRVLLKETMEKHGFRSIRTEWWHYSFDDRSFQLSDWLWPCDY